MIRRHELTDQEWELHAPLIRRAGTGRPRVSDRQVINGMVYKVRTVYTRFRRYALDGVERCFNRLKGFRGIATRYDKTATSYEAVVSLASFPLWARSV